MLSHEWTPIGSFSSKCFASYSALGRKNYPFYAECVSGKIGYPEVSGRFTRRTNSLYAGDSWRYSNTGRVISFLAHNFFGKDYGRAWIKYTGQKIVLFERGIINIKYFFLGMNCIINGLKEDMFMYCWFIRK